jgi:hypothetical protein
VASRFLENLYTPGVSIFRLPSERDPVHLPYLDFHNTATTTTATAAAAAITDDDNNVFSSKYKSDVMFELHNLNCH